MSPIDVIITAIRERRPLMFEYRKPGKTRGLRVGNPYVLYWSMNSSGKRVMLLSLMQTSGVTDQASEYPLPGWHTYNVDDMRNVAALGSRFILDPGYNPHSCRYEDVIAQI